MVAPRRLKRWGNTLLLCTSGGLSVQHWQQQSNQLHIAPWWRTQICVQQSNTAVTKCWAIHILEMTVLVVWREENLRNIQVTSKSHPSHVTWLMVCFLFFLHAILYAYKNPPLHKVMYSLIECPLYLHMENVLSSFSFGYVRSSTGL